MISAGIICVVYSGSRRGRTDVDIWWAMPYAQLLVTIDIHTQHVIVTAVA